MKERCPRCGRYFPDSSTVVNHLNQPISACLTYFEELRSQLANTNNSRSVDTQAQDQDTAMSEGTNVEQEPGGAPSLASTPVTPESIQNSDCSDDGMNVDPQPDDHSSQHETKSKWFTEEFPDASWTFGCGRTFMDVFDQDQFADIRKDQLYYPFASKEEWELASFLLRSCMSMAAIDRFLKLSLVSLSSLLTSSAFSFDKR